MGIREIGYVDGKTKMLAVHPQVADAYMALFGLVGRPHKRPAASARMTPEHTQSLFVASVQSYDEPEWLRPAICLPATQYALLRGGRGQCWVARERDKDLAARVRTGGLMGLAPEVQACLYLPVRIAAIWAHGNTPVLVPTEGWTGDNRELLMGHVTWISTRSGEVWEKAA